MSSSAVFNGLGKLFTDYLFLPFEWVGNGFNYFVILVGFFGLFYWLKTQKKLSDKAAKNGTLK